MGGRGARHVTVTGVVPKTTRADAWPDHPRRRDDRHSLAALRKALIDSARVGSLARTLRAGMEIEVIMTLSPPA